MRVWNRLPVGCKVSHNGNLYTKMGDNGLAYDHDAHSMVNIFDRLIKGTALLAQVVIQ